MIRSKIYRQRIFIYLFFVRGFQLCHQSKMYYTLSSLRPAFSTILGGGRRGRERGRGRRWGGKVRKSQEGRENVKTGEAGRGKGGKERGQGGQGGQGKAG